MGFDKKDEAIIKASALVGYCESVPTRFTMLTEQDRAILQKWIDGLLFRAKATGDAISHCWSETSDGETK